MSNQRESSQEHWVVLGSANGSTNLGDESMWEATVQELRRVRGPVHVYTDGHPAFDAPMSNVTVLPYLHSILRRGSGLVPALAERAISYPGRNTYALRRAAKLATDWSTERLAAQWRAAIANSVGVIVSGAGAVTDDYAAHGVAAWSLIARWAQEMAKPVGFLGQGVGPLSSPRVRAEAKVMLEIASAINVREAGSVEVIRGLGVRKAVSLSPDWAILNEPEVHDREVASELAHQLFDGKPFFALSWHRRHNTSRRDIAQLSKFGELFVRRALDDRMGVAFLPNMIATGYSDDRATFDLVASTWGSAAREAVKVIRTPIGSRASRAFLGLAIGVVATRYHPLVLSLAEQTPCVGISYDEYYDQKLRGASALFGLSQNVLPLASVEADDVLRCLEASHPLEVTSELDGNRLALADFVSVCTERG
ncbi:polysaccharide pyruvyl transferase family protein [Knoellia sp. p5-6-4]|uniref:polysaccharide pyruvyl transferase family protein n=1 Tax=unclassified Knoellia TaxID=2618719 RepID=UPI0023DA58B9|nr:polysaccharide pyruvyl transferase family protein [Knoellia sp. p5-6-4]MDF2144157.1 polysaccharide pyruvyl transferase family protein [Knoellia sp. p5-6-4]